MGACQCNPKVDGSNFQTDVIKYREVYEQQRGQLSDYKIMKELGQGAYGAVYHAQHKIAGQPRAIKFIKKESATVEDINLLVNEVNLLRGMDHPNIIKIYDYFEDLERFYIVTELCTGGELFDRIEKKSHFSEQEASQVMKQILSGLFYCHLQNIIHRDIKPENLIYDSEKDDSQLKLIDFGCAILTKGKLSDHVGTAYYVAPEVIAGEYDCKCDIWSAGVVLYILLCGFAPFDGKNDQQIYDKISKGEFSFKAAEWVSVSSEAKEMIRRMLESDPKKRISAEEALQSDWIQRHSQHVNQPIVQNALTNLKKFRTSQKLQEATYMYIVKQFASKEEKEELLRTFQELDKNGDGVLSKKELLDGYTKIMNQHDAEQIVDEIMQSVDKNNSGKIDYSEFVMATINKSSILTKERLEKAFQTIDKNGDQSVSVEELKAMFGGGSIPPETWQQLVQEVDKNGDGEISLQEFKDMMLKLAI